MAVSPMQAAKLICKLREWSVSNLEVQKILYIAHMLFVGGNNSPDDVRQGNIASLVNEEFQAWRLGPVVESLYHELKSYGDGSIQESAFVSVADIEESTREYQTIAQACSILEDFDSGRLIALTHDVKGAWGKIYDPLIRCNVISNDEVYREYQRRAAG